MRFSLSLSFTSNNELIFGLPIFFFLNYLIRKNVSFFFQTLYINKRFDKNNRGRQRGRESKEKSFNFSNWNFSEKSTIFKKSSATIKNTYMFTHRTSWNIPSIFFSITFRPWATTAIRSNAFGILYFFSWLSIVRARQSAHTHDEPFNLWRRTNDQQQPNKIEDEERKNEKQNPFRILCNVIERMRDIPHLVSTNGGNSDDDGNNIITHSVVVVNCQRI